MILLTVSLAVGDRLDVAAVTPVSWWVLGYLAVVVSLGAGGRRAVLGAAAAGGAIVLVAVVLVIVAERAPATCRGEPARSVR